MTWNEKRERIIAAAELGDAAPRVSVDLLVDARNRAFNAEQTAKKVQAELDVLKAAHVWIKTSERMPPRGSVVLVLFDNGHIGTGQCYLSASGSIELTEYAVAWMPLPEAPK